MDYMDLQGWNKPRQKPIKTVETLRPLGDLVLIELDEPETETKGGILLPEIAVERPRFGTVIASGEGNYDGHGNRVPNGVEVGEKVYCAKYSGYDVVMGERKLILIKIIDVLAVVE